MIHDITFCANPQQCEKKDTCRRAFPPPDVQYLSQCDFWKQYQMCNAYWPTIKEASK